MQEQFCKILEYFISGRLYKGNSVTNIGGFL